MKLIAEEIEKFTCRKMNYDQYDLEATTQESHGRWRQCTLTVYDQMPHLQLQMGLTNQSCLLQL